MDSTAGCQGLRVYQVSQLTAEIQTVLEARFDAVWLEGEISNFSAPSSGHYYMVLKDEKAQIRAAMFRPQARYLRFTPENGMKVLAQGRVGVYPPRGEYQLILDYIEPLGVGALALAFEQLKRKLADEGLFDAGLKKPLPFLPRCVAVITSPTGAAVRDFLKIIHRRFANLEVVVVPSRVQGNEALADLLNALEAANQELKADVIVLARGGGSLEDLWPFNQEELARAIRRSRVPVVSAVGHEIDWTIADMAADVRAPTPSAAAEMLVREKEMLERRLQELRERLARGMQYGIKAHEARLQSLGRALTSPGKLIETWWLKLDEIQGRLVRLVTARLDREHGRLRVETRSLASQAPMVRIRGYLQQLEFLGANLAGAVERRLEGWRFALHLAERRLQDLSPLGALKRGYSITYRLPDGALLKGTAGVERGDRLRILLGEGHLEGRVEQVVPAHEEP